ncbi:MAG TPA: imidazoleglycerol-phosphate dehydratase HisB [Candidatus Saccharimonadales bacterium]|nr:imidazoleglycerol-phosphate dehydratase HisB [Candidatus Saccharimonadales bacterium]
MKRRAIIKRKTGETKINLSLNIDGTGKRSIETPVGFLNHMLDLFAKHGLFDINIKAEGDMNIDEHHTVEDIGIVLGVSFAKALKDKKGINRYGFFYGFFILPMDEALATVAIDFAGRYSFRFECPFVREKVGDLSTELIKHFWDAFAQNAKVNLYIKVENGENEHHKIEAIFKSVARAIRMACEIDERVEDQIPSTKGKL